MGVPQVQWRLREVPKTTGLSPDGEKSTISLKTLARESVQNARVTANVNIDRKHLHIIALRTAIFPCILLAVAPIGLLGQTARIHVRVFDGRSGADLSGMSLEFVDYHTDRAVGTHGDLNGRMIVKTSADGDSYIAHPDVHGVLVFGGLGKNGTWTPCTRQKLYDSRTRTYGSEHLYPVSTIVASGLVASNHCSKRTATSKPGELIIFVRPVTWWEKFISAWES